MSANVLISCNSLEINFAKELNGKFLQNSFDTFLIDENAPLRLEDRAKLVQMCDIFLVLSSQQYQKSLKLMELLHYAKDLKKTIFAMNIKKTFVPFGALGAIAASAQNGLLQYDNPNDVDNMVQTCKSLLSYVNKTRTTSASNKDRVQSAIKKKISDYRISKDDHVDLIDSNVAVDVVISHHPEIESIAILIKKELDEKGIQSHVETSTKGISGIKRAKVLIVVMSTGYETSDFCREVVEQARQLNLEIIPVRIAKTWKSESWLGLAMSGKLFYSIFNPEQAHAKLYDSTPMNNLSYATKFALSARPSISDIERAQVESLRKKIDECKPKLANWPPKHKDRPIPIKPVKIKFEEPVGKLELHHQHYEVTRMDFNPPQPLFDNYGTPLRHTFDCMISYQWDKQELVRNVYMDLHMKSLKIWFDIWGGKCKKNK
jgi:hypothetical protein